MSKEHSRAQDFIYSREIKKPLRSRQPRPTEKRMSMGGWFLHDSLNQGNTIEIPAINLSFRRQVVDVESNRFQTVVRKIDGAKD